MDPEAEVMEPFNKWQYPNKSNTKYIQAFLNVFLFSVPFLEKNKGYTGWPKKSKPLSRIIIKSY